MNLLIHDMNENEWNKIAKRYTGYKIISNNNTIKPCVGCFGCWVRQPGQCVMKDGYEHMGALIHKADEVVVISRYTYGGFSSFVKNVFDRSIGLVLPYFEVYEREMHHKKRYPEVKPFTFIFRGTSFTVDEKKKAEAYVKAVCRNCRGKVKKLKFVKCDPVIKHPQSKHCVEDRIILLNGSLRGDNANTRKFLSKLSDSLVDGELINLSVSRQKELIQTLLSARTIVLGMPLYVDGIPSQLVRIMERLEQEPGDRKKIYVVANMGLYESHQMKNLLNMVKDWSKKCGYDYCGGIAIGAGEMIKMFINGKGPARNAVEGIEKLAAAVNTSTKTEDIYADAYRFPRWLYILAANAGWPKAGRSNGLKKKDLLRRQD